MKIAGNTFLISFLLWCTILYSADSYDLKHQGDTEVFDWNGITLRLSAERINREEILKRIKSVDARRIIIFIKLVKKGETTPFFEDLDREFPKCSLFSTGFGPHSMMVEIASNVDRPPFNGYSGSHLTAQQINKERIMVDIGKPGAPCFGEKRVVWFYKSTTSKKLLKLVTAINETHPHPRHFKITTWLIGKRSGMIEIDWNWEK